MMDTMKQTWGAKSRQLLWAMSLILAGGLLLSLQAKAQDYPSEPVTVIVPHATGSNLDTIIRLLQPELEEILGQPVIVENRSGAGATIGAQSVVRAEPDGYTIMFSSGSPITRNPFMQRDYPFDPLNDLEPISRTSEVYAIMVAPVDAPFDTTEELIAYAEERPGELTYSSAGVGSANHVVGELLNSKAGINIEHVPYEGGSATINALVGGHVSLSYGGMPAIMPHVEDGTFKMIASADHRRVPELPDLPAINETVPDVGVSSWHAFFAPSGTPPAIIDTLSEAIRTALEDDQIAERLSGLGVHIVASTPEELAEWSVNEYNAHQAAFSEIGIEAQ